MAVVCGLIDRVASMVGLLRGGFVSTAVLNGCWQFGEATIESLPLNHTVSTVNARIDVALPASSSIQIGGG